MQTITDKDSLYQLMKGKTPLATLSMLSEAIENDLEILQLIQAKQQERIEEQHRNHIGEEVEQLLKKALEKRGFEVKKERYGKDLVISLLGKLQKIDIEIKSTNSNRNVAMTKFQAETAISRGQNYVLWS